jgi:acyl-CoA thioester hydrolase
MAIDKYVHVLEIPTRWNDNDVYGHVNNVHYYSFFDTVINTYLIDEGGLDIYEGSAIGLCVESHCVFRTPLAFPAVVRAGLRVATIGRSSVRYEVGLFSAPRDDEVVNNVNAVRTRCGMGAGRLVRRSTKTWTNHPSADS